MLEDELKKTRQEINIAPHKEDNTNFEFPQIGKHKGL